MMLQFGHIHVQTDLPWSLRSSRSRFSPGTWVRRRLFKQLSIFAAMPPISHAKEFCLMSYVNYVPVFRAFTTYLVSLAFLIFTAVVDLEAQTTSFVYQGQLQSASAPANGSFDFEFLLFDSLAGVAQVGPTVPRNGTSVVNGVF